MSIATQHAHSKPRQLDLFQSRLPKKPYCSDDLGQGLLIRSATTAVQRRYIQPNPPALQAWLVFDVDRPGAAMAWEDADLPPPMWTAANPQNAHAHLAYGLEIPVVTSDAARPAPVRLAAAIEAAYRDRLGADVGYSGLITKNPLHRSWEVRWWTEELYDLTYLSEFVDLAPYNRKNRRNIPEQGLGRNCLLFERLRRWAYRTVDQFRVGGMPFEAWHKAVLGKAEDYNGGFNDPLMVPEVKATAKSIANWTWTRYIGRLPDEQFAAIQAERGRRSGRTRLAQSQTRAEQARSLREAGKSNREIGEILSIHPKSVPRLLRSS